MYEIIKNVIDNKIFNLPDILKKIDAAWTKSDLTDGQKDELYTLARENADAQISMDVYAKLEELDRRITALETSDTSPETPGENIEEYIAGKWYYNGNKVRFNGEVYICTAPVGTVCVWSPAEYPAYWSKSE